MNVFETVAEHHIAHDSETGLLASILIDEQAFDDTRELVQETDFFSERNRVIWRHLVGLNQKKKPLALDFLVQSLKDANQLDFVGGLAYLIGMRDYEPTSIFARDYAITVAEKAQLRALELAGKKIMLAARDNADVGEALKLASEAFTLATSRNHSEHSVKPLMTGLAEVYQRNKLRGSGQKIAGIIKTGLVDFDSLTGGFEPGQLVVMAARPGMGKTVGALQVAINAARANESVFFQSLEMGQDELLQRAAALRAAVDYGKIRRGQLDYADENKIMALSELPNLLIDDRAGLDIDQIIVGILRQHRKSPLTVVVIDHLHRISHRAGSKGNDVAELNYMVKQLKNLAKSLHIPILLLAQLSRGNENATDKKPSMHHLRGCGGIEEEADMVIFPYRKSYYSKDPKDTSAEWIIAKSRSGYVGSVALLWRGALQRFESIAKSPIPHTA